MGIPRLTQDLSGYSEVAVLGTVAPAHHDGQVRVSKVVIDGPSLVYHVYDGLLRRMTPADIASAAVPTYSNVVEGVKSCLDALKSQGVSIAAILFDGNLPVTKRRIRLERMENMRKQLENFRKLHPKLHSIQDDRSLRAGSPWDLCNKPVSNSRHALPPSPFLVPAILDAARLSWDIPGVDVVPEEADVGCARLSRALGAAILTNDSDLALYDLGPEGCVLLLRTLTSTEVNGSRTSKATDFRKSDTVGSNQRLLVSCLRPAQIAQRLSLPSLLSLGFERSLDSSASTATVLQSAKESSTDKEKRQNFDGFQKQFQILGSPPLCRPFDGLDPRISEFITQANASSDSPHVYLPILHEDPSRDSSWSYGLVYRQLAYSIYYSSCYPSGSGPVIEYVRKGSRIAPNSITLLDDIGIAATIEGMLEDLMGLAERLRIGPAGGRSSCDIVSVSDWYAVSLCIVLQHRLAAARTPPSHQDIDSIFGLDNEWKATPTSTHTWDDVHLLANAHAVLYSWRILSRIIDWTIQNPGKGATDELKACLEDLGMLKTCLETMPMISDLFLDLRQLRAIEPAEGRKNASEVVKRLRDVQVGGNVQTHARNECGSMEDGEENRSKKPRVASKQERIWHPSSRNAYSILVDVGDDDEADDDDG